MHVIESGTKHRTVHGCSSGVWVSCKAPGLRFEPHEDFLFNLGSAQPQSFLSPRTQVPDRNCTSLYRSAAAFMPGISWFNWFLLFLTCPIFNRTWSAKVLVPVLPVAPPVRSVLKTVCILLLFSSCKVNSSHLRTKWRIMSSQQLGTISRLASPPNWFSLLSLSID